VSLSATLTAQPSVFPTTKTTKSTKGSGIIPNACIATCLLVILVTLVVQYTAAARIPRRLRDGRRSGYGQAGESSEDADWAG
jgi:hypothetical protein